MTTALIQPEDRDEAKGKAKQATIPWRVATLFVFLALVILVWSVALPVIGLLYLFGVLS